MRPAYETPEILAVASPASEIDADLLAIPWFEDDASSLPDVDAATGGEIGAALARGEFHARLGELFSTRAIVPGWKTPRLVIVGGGRRDGAGVEQIRRMAASVGLLARQQRHSRVAWIADGNAPELAAAVAEGLTIANFDNGQYKSRDADGCFVRQAVVTASAEASEAIERGRIVGEAVNAARVLINEPGNHLTPRVFAERAVSLAAVPGVHVEVLDEQRIEDLKMGLLLGVARGSAEPPRLIALTYEPEGARAEPVLGLVGKGITFDTGGISIKPSDGMERMKDDMAGGAAVIAAVRAIARLKLPIKVIGVVPTTENMPGGRAVKPGDVLRGASGLTVEVNNTDAEGRLILGDGLWYARQLGATHLVDIATLTGACIVALGRITSGLFGRPDSWVETIRKAAAGGGERVWPLPIFDEYKESLKSDIADMVNSPGRPAGAITAAKFLEEFAGDVPWAHLDIAGTAWAEESKPWAPKGATGAMVPTLVELAQALAR